MTTSDIAGIYLSEQQLFSQKSSLTAHSRPTRHADTVHYTDLGYPKTRHPGHVVEDPSEVILLLSVSVSSLLGEGSHMVRKYLCLER
jgi:hypothetical protein